jgi:gluconokinase
MVIVLMGVTGCGKTTVGKMLAKELGWLFYDADDFHPEENVEKMKNGIPLNDEDRVPWLQTLANLIHSGYENQRNMILACSALKKRYRSVLHHDLHPVKFVYLKGEMDLIRERLEARKGHYMNPVLLKSQFDALEEPGSDEPAVAVDISPAPLDILNAVKETLQISC